MHGSWSMEPAGCAHQFMVQCVHCFLFPLYVPSYTCTHLQLHSRPDLIIIVNGFILWSYAATIECKLVHARMRARAHTHTHTHAMNRNDLTYLPSSPTPLCTLPHRLATYALHTQLLSPLTSLSHLLHPLPLLFLLSPHHLTYPLYLTLLLQ